MDYVDVVKTTGDRMGGLLKRIWLAPLAWFASIKTVEVLPPLTYTTVADAAALAALTPSAGDYAYQTDTTTYKKYNGSSWVDITSDVCIIDTHTFASGKGFIYLDTTVDTGKLMSEILGERDGRGKRIKIEGFYPGTVEAAIAFERSAKNDEFICIVQDPNGGTFQIGTEDLPAEVTSTQDTGTISSGRNGMTFSIEAFANHLIPYKGTITPKP